MAVYCTVCNKLWNPCSDVLMAVNESSSMGFIKKFLLWLYWHRALCSVTVPAQSVMLLWLLAQSVMLLWLLAQSVLLLWLYRHIVLCYRDCTGTEHFVTVTTSTEHYVTVTVPEQSVMLLWLYRHRALPRNWLVNFISIWGFDEQHFQFHQGGGYNACSKFETANVAHILMCIGPCIILIFE